eukprot:4812052-Prymnesium_polylepis.1
MAFGSSLAGRKVEPGPTWYHTVKDGGQGGRGEEASRNGPGRCKDKAPERERTVPCTDPPPLI